MRNDCKFNLGWNKEKEQITEATEKMIICEIDRKFDIIMDIVKVNTEAEIGDRG